MEYKYADRVEEILKNDKTGKINREFDKLLEESKDDTYVVLKAVEFKMANHFGHCEELLEVLKYQEMSLYFEYASYYLAVLYANKGKYDEALHELSLILYNPSQYSDEARRLYPELLYDNEQYEEVVKFYEELKAKNKVNDKAAFYAGKVYHFNHDYNKAKELVKEAIELNSKEIEYHNFIRGLYQDTKDYRNALREVRTLQKMDIKESLKNKLDLIAPVLLCELKNNAQAFQAIKQNVDKGLTNANQDQTYIKLAAIYGDYKTVENLSDEVKKLHNFCSKYFRPVVIAYQAENLCDKALDLINSDAVDKSVFEVKFSEANTLIQMGRLEEAEYILNYLMSKSNNPQYRLNYALCLFMEGKFDKARYTMKSIPVSDKRLDIYLRYELGMLDLRKFNTVPKYAKLLDDYDFEVVYKDIRNRLTDYDRQYQLDENVNIKRFAYEMKEVVESLNPSYTFDKDYYLLDYGTEIASLNGTKTSYFLADAIPGRGLITIRPVIPSPDGKENYQRIR